MQSGARQLALRLEGDHAASREHFVFRPLESPRELETIRRLRYPLYRWKVPYPPDTDATLDDLPEANRRYFVVTAGGRCMGGAAVWWSDQRLEGFDLGKDPSTFARIGRLVLHPDCVGRTLVILPPDGSQMEPVRRIPVGLALMGLVLACALYEFGRNHVASICLPKTVGMYRKLGFSELGPPFDHAFAYGEPVPPHSGLFVPMGFNYPLALAANERKRAGMHGEISSHLFERMNLLCRIARQNA